MAKKRSGDQFLRALANARRSGRAMRRDRESDFRVTSGVVDAIFGNLSTTSAGLSRSMQGVNQEQVQALRALARRSAKQTRAASKGAVKDIVQSFGTGFEGVARQDLQVERATGAKARTDAATAAQAGGAVARSGLEVMSIMDKGIAEAAHAADYATAQALNYRVKNDETLVAQMTHDIQMARLQAKLDFDNWKRQQEYLQKLEEGKSGGAYQGMTLVAEHMATASSHLRAMFAADPDANVSDIVQEYVQKYGVANEAETVVLNALAASIKQQGIFTGGQEPGRAAEVDAIMDSLLTLYPNYRGHRKELQKLIELKLRTIYNMSAEEARTAAAQAVSGSSPSPGPGVVPGQGFGGAVPGLYS